MGARLDQHFLTSESVADRAVAAAGRPSRFLEIGPGRGILTGRLLRLAPVVAVELDRGLAGALSGRFPGAALTVLQGDFLKIALEDLPTPCAVVSNLPYSVGTPILQRLLDWPGWGTAVLMFQREVAERCLARAGEGKFGLLGLSVQLKAEVERVCDAPPGCFSPPPKVDSTVLRFKRLSAPRLPAGLSEEALFRVARAAFSQRRKMAAKAISAGLGLARHAVDAAFAAAGIELSARAETIPLEGFTLLARALPSAPGAGPGESAAG